MGEQIDIDSMLSALDERVDDLAKQVYEHFARQIPEARQWSEQRRDAFVAQARGRLGAVLAVIEQGAEVDEALQRDLEVVGATAASAGSSVPHILMVLRISRDVLLRETVRIGDDRAVLDFSARLLPAIDRLTDALTLGFWSSTAQELDEEREQFATLLDEVPSGVYETDLDGVIVYANSCFEQMFSGTNDVVGRPLTDVVKTVGSPSTAALFSEVASGEPIRLLVDAGSEEPLQIVARTIVRRDDSDQEAEGGGDLVGFGGVLTVSADH